MKVVLGALFPILLGVVYVVVNSSKGESESECVVDDVVPEYFNGRDQLVHAIRAPLGISFPRVSLEELMDKENRKTEDFRLGRRPFVVSNVSDEWDARSSWNNGAESWKISESRQTFSFSCWTWRTTVCICSDSEQQFKIFSQSI